jgi:hypothetical protein
MIRVIIMPLPQLGQWRRGIGYLIWVVGCEAYTEIPSFRIAPREILRRDRDEAVQ